MSMPSIRIAVCFVGLLPSVLAFPVLGEPTRKIVALGYDGIETKPVAEHLADVASRCWIGRVPEFDGLKFERTELGAEENRYRVGFPETRKSKMPQKQLRIVVGQEETKTIFSRTTVTIVVVDQEGVDASGVIGQAAKAIVKGRSPSC